MAVGGRSAGEIPFEITGDTSDLGRKIQRDLTRGVDKVNRDLERSLTRSLNQVRPNAAPWLALSGAVRTLNADTARATASFTALNAAKTRALAPHQLPVLNGHLRSATGSVNSLASGFGGMGASSRSGAMMAVGALQSVLATAAAATTAVTGLGVAISTIGLKSASDLQNVELAINSLGDQLQDISVDNMVASLRQMSIESGISLGRLGKVAQGFVSLGISGEGALGMIKAQLDGLAASGNLTEAAIQGVSRALQQIGSKPLLQLEELNQIADQIPAASRLKIINQIVEDTGDSVAEVQERFRLGTQQSGEALTAVLKVINDLDVSGQALENRAKTIGGAFDIMKATAQNALADIFTPIATRLAEEIGKLDVEGMTQRVAEPLARAMDTLIPTAIQALPDIIEGIAFAFEILSPVIAGTASAAANFARLIVENKEPILAAISDLSDFMAGLIDVIEELAPAFEPTLVTLGIGIDVLGKFGQALSFLSPAFKIVGNIAAVAFNPFLGSINLALHAIEQLLEAVGKIPSGIPLLGNIASGADAAAANVRALRAELSLLGSAAASASSTSMTGGNKLPPGAYKPPSMPKTDFKLPTFPNTAAGLVGGGGSGSSAASKAATAAKALSSALDGLLGTLKKYAKETGEQSLTTIQSNAERVMADIKEAIEKANAAGNRSLARVLNNQMGVFRRNNARLVALAKRRDRVLDQLDKAKDNLRNLQNESKSFTDSIKNNVRDLGSVMRDTGGINVTFTGMRNNLRKALIQTRQFTAAIDNLRRLGLNETSLRQIAEAGPGEGLRQALILSRSGQGGVNQINQLQGELEKAGQTLATGLNNEFYTAGIKAAEGLVKGLDSQHAALVKAMDRLADTLVARIKTKLKIKSPSQVMEEEVGEMLPAGVARGIRRGGPDVAAAMERLAAVNSRTQFGPGSVVVNGVSDERAARRTGFLIAAGVRETLDANLADLKLKGEA